MKIIKLFSKTHGNFEIIVDNDDYERIIQYKWHITKHTTSFVIQRHIYNEKGIRTCELLHRFILNINNSNIGIDHKNGNTLDNRKKNLRIATQQQNSCNTKIKITNKTAYKGVCWHKASKKYVAKICFKGNYFWLGCFNTPEEASEVYEVKAKELFGEFYRKSK